jgi:hypothetical protein
LRQRRGACAAALVASWIGVGVGAAPAWGQLDMSLDTSRLGDKSGFFELGPHCGVTLESPAGNFLNFRSYQGLGHLGGLFDGTIDSGEVVDVFVGEGGDHDRLNYTVFAAVDEDTDGKTGEGYVEAFDASGSLGVEPVDGIGTIDVSALFGHVPINYFALTSVERVVVSSIGWQIAEGEPFQTTLVPAASFVIPNLTQCGISFSSPQGDLDVDGSHGIGVVGGASGRIETGENLDVYLPRAVPALGYRLSDATNVGGTATLGEHFVEAFDAKGHSLGLRSEGGSDVWIDLAADYGGPSIARFTLIGVNDEFRLDAIRFVPEPSSLATGAIAAVALLVRRSALRLALRRFAARAERPGPVLA